MARKPRLGPHTQIIVEIARQLKPEVYVELGLGGMSNFRLVAPHCRKAVGVEINPVHSNFPDNCLIKDRTRTEDFLENWEGRIDMAFVDADHNWESARADSLGILKHLARDTGVMLMHDTWPPDARHLKTDRCGTVNRVPGMLRDSELGPELEITTLPIRYGLTVVRRRGEAWQNFPKDAP